MCARQKAVRMCMYTSWTASLRPHKKRECEPALASVLLTVPDSATNVLSVSGCGNFTSQSKAATGHVATRISPSHPLATSMRAISVLCVLLICLWLSTLRLEIQSRLWVLMNI